MKDSYTYPLQIRWNAPHGGIVGSHEDGLPPLTVASPPEFGGPALTWSPEHMFVASIASCFMTTLLAIAELSKLEIRAFEAGAVGTLVRGEDRRYRFSEVVIRPRLVLAKEKDRERALRILEKSEDACLITNSISAKVRVEPALETAEPAEVDSALAVAGG